MAREAGAGPIRDGALMVARMAPLLLPGEVAFVSVTQAEAASATGVARALVREAEGVTLILPCEHPLCPADALPMRQITLTVHSALDGVGLTAAVSGALAAAGIPCNIVAGVRHDHLFVPAGQAELALATLEARARA